MSTYRIGQLAERAGFTTSALRYYERHGLLRPVERSDAGYRLYDETSEARLCFIARAKQLGCTLEEIVDLVDLLEREDCGPVQSRLHALVTAKIDDVTRRTAESIQFAAQLQDAARLLGGEPIDGPCGGGCACLGATEPSSGPERRLIPVSPEPIVLGQDGDPAIACRLDRAEIPDRLVEWRQLLTSVVDRRPTADGAGLRLTLDPAVSREELMRLVVAEQDCCRFFAFAITVDDRGLALEARAPDGATDVVTAVFGAAGPS